MKKFIEEFRAYKEVTAWNRKNSSSIRARFVYCPLKEKYLCLIGNRVHEVCRACVTVIKNF